MTTTNEIGKRKFKKGYKRGIALPIPYPVIRTNGQ